MIKQQQPTDIQLVFPVLSLMANLGKDSPKAVSNSSGLSVSAIITVISPDVSNSSGLSVSEIIAVVSPPVKPVISCKL
jgi:hypothetical protein